MNEIITFITMHTTITIIKVAITFPQPILPISLNASTIFKDSTKLLVFANLALPIDSINEKIINNIKATTPTIVSEVAKFDITTLETVPTTGAVALAVALTLTIAVEYWLIISYAFPCKLVKKATITTIIVGIMK